MIDGKKVLALIPARGGSKGLLGKNKRPLLGVPLVAWPIKAALGCALVDRVVVSTDDPEIACLGKAYGAEIPFFRPKELASDDAKSADVVLHALNWFREKEGMEYHYLVLLEPTSPATTSEDISLALYRLNEARDQADAIVGTGLYGANHPAFALQTLPDGRIAPIGTGESFIILRRQEAKPLYFMDGSLYISTVKAFFREKSFYHRRTLSFVFSKWKNFEIDDEEDFIIIEALMKSHGMIGISFRKGEGDSGD